MKTMVSGDQYLRKQFDWENVYSMSLSSGDRPLSSRIKPSLEVGLLSVQTRVLTVVADMFSTINFVLWTLLLSFIVD